MLNLKEIRKDYQTASETVHALKGVSIAFRKSEFVSILGPSGCGKTTMLNIIGGLDKYTSGDLSINGRSTKSYTDRDWDVYRNHRIGFIFQSYNLIPHQSVLGNVELALTIAGISRSERVARAKRALDRVGLAGQYHKRPNQLSGGQCQRVAIARALVNDPEILLADEPTGALDTVTSVQIMDLIKEISEERLVIMVTHNPELAEQYSSRIVKLLDGEIVEDSNPFSETQEKSERTTIIPDVELSKSEVEKNSEIKNIFRTSTNRRLQSFLPPEEISKNGYKSYKKRKEKAKMSFFTAFMLSLKNLFTKKGRTTLTAFAGSIGIIGIALILAVSQGMTMYIDHVQETTLSAYPLTLEATTIDASALIETFFSEGEEPDHPNDAVYKDPLIADLVDALSKVETSKNDLRSFKEYLETELSKDDSELKNAVTGIQYSYNLELPIYTLNQDGHVIKSDTAELMTQMLAEYMIGVTTGKGGMSDSSNSDSSSSSSSSMQAGGSMMTSMMGLELWEELLSGTPDKNGNKPLVNDLLKEQYDVVHGHWPESANEIVLVLNEYNELDDLTLYALGLLNESEIDAIIAAAVNRKPLPEGGKNRWTYEEICNLTFKTILPSAFYEPNTLTNDGTFRDISKDPLAIERLYRNSSIDLKVVGIIRPNENAETTMLSGKIAYTSALTEQVITESLNSPVVKAQLANPEIDILTGLPFRDTTGRLTAEQKKEEFLKHVNELSDEEKIELYVAICYFDYENVLKTTALSMITEENKSLIISAMIAGLASEGGDTTQIEEYLSGLSLEELRNIFKPYAFEIYLMMAQTTPENVYNGFVQNLETQFPTDEAKLTHLNAILSANNEAATKAIAEYYENLIEFSTSTYENTLIKIGHHDLDTPYQIHIFASSFENKDVIVEKINDYNNSVDETKKISYTDFIGIMMSSITIIINAITYVLIAFVAISLVVSSIMIGVITLISVQERTKEIGVLRAIGASKKDVSSMFNAETIIIGLASGLLGVGVTYLLCIPINLILHALTGIPTLNAVLPVNAAIILVVISVLLTLISGFIPSRSAAKKDPVVALRTE